MNHIGRFHNNIFQIVFEFLMIFISFSNLTSVKKITFSSMVIYIYINELQQFVQKCNL